MIPKAIYLVEHGMSWSATTSEETLNELIDKYHVKNVYKLDIDWRLLKNEE